MTQDINSPARLLRPASHGCRHTVIASDHNTNNLELFDWGKSLRVTGAAAAAAAAATKLSGTSERGEKERKKAKKDQKGNRES